MPTPRSPQRPTSRDNDYDDMYSSQRGRYRGHDERDRHAGLCDYVHDRDSRDYDDAEQHRGRSKSPPPRRSSPSQGRWDRTVVPRNREPHGRHHITPSHRRGSRRQNTNVRGGRHDGSDADDRDIEEDQEIPEELDGEADVNWAFYNKLFRTLRATKSSKWSIRDKASPAGQLSKLGRLIPRMQGPFVDMSLIVTVGMSWYSGTPPRWNVPEDRLSPKQRQDLAKEKHYVKVFEWLQERLPFLEQVVPLMVGQAHDTFILGAFLDTHARQARATDLNSLKKCIPDYVEEALITPSLQKVAPPNNNQRKNKHWYGWHSVWTARLLVPRASRDEFDDDPQMFCDAVIGMDVKIDHEDYPSFLYSDDEEFDKDAIDVGLLRSGLLIKTVRHVLTSPSSVTKPAGKKGLGRGCISQIYKLDRVAPETIAYVATLVRNLLSSSETWEVKDGDFDGQEFYANIIKLFKGGRSVDEDWVRETLIFWNSSVYGTAMITPGALAIRRPAAVPQTSLLEQQRAARAARRMATVNPPPPAPEPSSRAPTPHSDASPETSGPAPVPASATSGDGAE